MQKLEKNVGIFCLVLWFWFGFWVLWVWGFSQFCFNKVKQNQERLSIFTTIFQAEFRKVTYQISQKKFTETMVQQLPEITSKLLEN